MKEILIFSQSSGDIIHVLNLYEKYKEDYIVSIFCIFNRDTYDFFISLNLKLKTIELIEYGEFPLNFKKPLSVLFTKYKLKKIYLRYFKKTSGCDVFFHVVWYDWITFYLINKLRNRNKIIYNRYITANEAKIKPKSFKEIYSLMVYRFLATYKLNYVLSELSNKIIFFPYKEKYIHVILPLKLSPLLLNKYSYKPNNYFQKSILIYETDFKEFNIFEGYQDTLIKIISFYKEKGYNIYIKGHPRVGSSDFLKYCDIIFLPSYYPGEFIDITKFEYVFGIITNTIAELSKKFQNVFSLIDLFSFTDEKTKRIYKDSLIENSFNQIRFISKLEN